MNTYDSLDRKDYVHLSQDSMDLQDPFFFSTFANQLIKGQGRILVRKSGTESKIRVMGESKNKLLLKKCIKIIIRTIN